jgi:HprK-related kinase A
MKLRELKDAELADRLRGAGVDLEVGPFAARIGTSFPELAESIRLLYADYRLDTSGRIVDFEVRVDPASPLRRWIRPQGLAYLDGEPAFDPFPRRLALPMLEWALNWCTFSRPNRFLILHAAVVEHGGQALLIPGPPGAGKSTLCAGLVLRGWRLLSDEVALIPPGEAEVIPVPRPIGLKEESIRIVREFAPGAVLGPSFAGTRKGTVAHLRPPTDSVARGEEPATARWIVFPQFDAVEPPELVSVPKARALLELGLESFNYSLLGAAGFEALAALIERCDCYRLVYGDLAQGVAVLNDLCARTADASTSFAAGGD